MDLSDKKILVIGASADLAINLNEILYKSGAVVGFHYNKNKKALSCFIESQKIKKFQKDLNCSKACYELIDKFVDWAGGIDFLIQLSGDINRPVHWELLKEEDWSCDLSVNMIMPFFLAQRAVNYMKDNGGRVILMSTASAAHGGGSTSLAYGVAKGGIEGIVKRLAKDCARHNILVNAIAPGFIITKFHTERMKKTQKELKKRIDLIPLGRAGTAQDFANAVIFLLSKGSSYITGQTINVSGGDWL